METSLPTHVFPASNDVLGEGPSPCQWMFIGEAPGAEEDRSGRPFVGSSGRLLNRLLEYYTDLRRPQVYVTNAVKHRPPKNRTPKVSEVKPYLPALWEEIARVRPSVIVTLGAVAARVIDKRVKLTDDHGVAREHELKEVYAGYPFIHVPWFHPSFALRNPRIFEQLASDAARLFDEVGRVSTVSPRTDYALADEDTVVRELLKRWCTFGFDTETTSPTQSGVFMTDQADMVGYSVSIAPGQGWYVPTTKVGVGMAAILESPLWTKVCHNTKFEHKILRKQGIELTGFEDTKLAAYLLGEPRTGLNTLTKQYLGKQPITYEEVTGGRQMSELPPEDVAEYAAMDADHTLSLWPVFHRRLVAEELTTLYTNVERPLIPVLSEMETQGMCVDVDVCNEVRVKLSDAIIEASVRILDTLDVVGVDTTTFNINSRDQLADILEHLGAPLKKRTEKKNRLVVDVNALNGIRDWNPTLIDPLLDYAKYAKFTSYVNNFIELRGPDGKLHTSFNQSGHWEEAGGSMGSAPSTGRLSSSGPNLQNIPHHRARVGETDWGHELRRCLVASPGNVLLSADLGQEEPRIVAVLADDTTLLDGFANDRDIYRPATQAIYPHTISELLDNAWKQMWDAWERYNGKQFFLAWYYGAGASRLKKLDKDLTPYRVRQGLEMLSEAHPARQAYLDETWRQLQEYGYVLTLHGRKRWITKAWSPRVKEREEALREGANARVQGTAADILKLALPRVHRSLHERGLAARLVSTVHDEVILDVPEREVTEVAKIVQSAFEGLLSGVPLILETFIGYRLGERKRLT